MARSCSFASSGWVLIYHTGLSRLFMICVSARIKKCISQMFLINFLLIYYTFIPKPGKLGILESSDTCTYSTCTDFCAVESGVRLKMSNRYFGRTSYQR